MSNNDTEKSFRVDLRLLLELGERLISRDEVAVVELVKNSFDADANEVSIIIDYRGIEVTDDGHGMDIKQINEGWFTIGTSIKKRDSYSPKGRKVLGEKGLGRLALFRLGKVITIYTKKEKGDCYKIVMDWEHAKKLLDMNEYAPLSKMVLQLTKVNENIFPKGHGTKININKLNSTWDNKNIEKIRISLSRLIDPSSSESDKFSIKLTTDNDEIKIEPPEVLKKPSYSLESFIDSKGIFTGTIKLHFENKTEPITIDPNNINKIVFPYGEEVLWKSAEEGGCGPFKFSLNMWDLDDPNISEYITTIRDWSGISLFRDGFRVAQPDIDWLGLDLRRVQNPSLRFSTNQIIGNIYISSKDNPNLIDKTDREGVIENDAFYIMTGCIYYIMNFLERERFKVRRKRAPTSKIIVDKLDTKPLREIIVDLPSQKQIEINKYIDNIDSFRESLKEWMLGRDRLSTMGILVNKLIHSSRNELVKITDNYQLIKNQAVFFDPPLRRALERMVEGGQKLSEIYKQYDPLLRFKSKRREKVVLSNYIDLVKYTFEKILNNNNILLTNEVKNDVELMINSTDVYIILSNLIDNSIYWLNTVKKENKKIEIRGSDNDGYIILEIADNGPGIDLNYIDQIFEPGFSLKPNGTGMGLAIIKDLLDLYNAEIFVGSDTKLKGALFKIIFKKGDGKK